MSLWRLGILFQGLVIAFTIFLGRIYAITYYEVLGIPVSEIQLSAIDYAIVSPAVAVMGIGLSITLGSFFLLSGPLTRLRFSISFKRILGLILLVASLVIVILSQTVDTDSVIRSLQIVLSIAMLAYGVTMLGSGMGVKTKRNDLGSKQKLDEELASLKVLFGIVAVVLVILYGTYAYIFSYLAARGDAMDALHQSPQATVQFVSGDSGSFRVIMIGKQFMYLLPEESEELRAFPLNNIEMIDYAGWPEPSAQ